MISLPLQLRYGVKARRAAAGWVVPGLGPREWLEELLRWGVPLAEVVLRVLPQAKNDLRPRGVLAVPPAGLRPRVTPLAQPYACLAGRVFVPIESRFEPEVAEPELALFLGSEDHTYLWHPALGLVAFEPADVVRVKDLLAGPRRQEAAWDRAQPGVAINRRILSIEPETVPTLEAVFREGRGDIGTEPLRPEELPPSPDETAGGAAGRIGRKMRSILAHAAQWLTTGQAPTGAVGRMAAWAERQLARLSRELLTERHREIARLLHLLDNDPDEGLKYAPPLASRRSARGFAPPGSRLGRRDPDFHLGRLGGGGPVDPWDLPGEFHQRLLARYRELANRELRLGRHRRAAYIFAELLGDFEAAAAALAAGGHWREAAVLYREQLNRPWDAARCLEQGGLWTEAIALYEELKAYEKVGDLYARLDQRENAEKAWRLAVYAHEQAGNHLEAAKLLEQKLGRPDEAIQQLDAGWPASRQAGQCLVEGFRLLGRLGRHDEAMRRVEQASWRSVPEHAVWPLLSNLAGLAASYPDEPVRRRAADATRKNVAELLPRAMPEQAAQYVDLVAALVPEDRLLARDCQRYVTKRRESARPPPPPAAPRPKAGAITLVRTFALPPQTEWHAAATAGTTFYAVGCRNGTLALVRGRFDGNGEVAVVAGWRMGGSAARVLLVPDPQETEPLIVHAVGCKPLEPKVLLAARGFHGNQTAGSPAWMPEKAVAAGRDLGGLLWALAAEPDHMVLSSYSRWGAPVASKVIPVPEDLQTDVASFLMHVRDTAVYLGMGDCLLKVHADYRTTRIALPGEVVSLSGTRPHTVPRIAAALEQGACVFFDDCSRGHLERFAMDLVRPAVAFTTGGSLVAATAGRLEVYRTYGHRVVLEQAMTVPALLPFAVLPGPDARQFAVLNTDGTLELYRLT